jgi:cell division GTPase FtsZ
MSELIRFGLSESKINLISVAGIGVVGEGAVKYMQENGLTGIDYYLFSSNQTSVEIDHTMNILKSKMFYHRLVFIVGSAVEVSETKIFYSLGTLINEFGSLNIGVLAISVAFDKNEKSKQIESINYLKKCFRQIYLISTEHILCSAAIPSLEDRNQQLYQQIMLAIKTIKDVLSYNNVVRIDFADINSLSDCGDFGIVTSAIAAGERRCMVAFDLAINTYLNFEVLKNTRKYLIYIAYGTDEVKIKELVDLLDYFDGKINNTADLLWSSGFDSDLGKNVCVTIFSAGLEMENI